MRVVFYKLPSPDGENVLVMERPFFECEVALLMGTSDEHLPLFEIWTEDGKIEIVEAEETEPYFNLWGDGMTAVLPARNADEAYALVKHIEREVVKIKELQDDDG